MNTVPNNICFDTDFYKMVHWKMLPDGVTRIYSYCESRYGAMFDHVKFFGIIPLIKEHFAGVVVTESLIAEAEYECQRMGGYFAYFNREMWEHILHVHGGKLPLEIKALAEGSIVPVNTPLFTITCTDDKCAPLVNHCETILTHVWHATTVATVSHNIKTKVLEFLERSGTPSLIEYMVHDFGYRGVECHFAAMMAGMAHLTNFVGTDNNIAHRAIKYFYNDVEGGRGKSVWATEHSIATSFGPGDGEYDYIIHQLKNAPDDAVISIVCDSYDTYNFAKNVVGRDDIKQLIINRKGRTVLRPDSGKPPVVVNRLLNILGEAFGYEYNNKGEGYKVLKHNVGVLQGDGMDYDSITGVDGIYESIMTNGWSADNLVVGSGGGLLQKWNRDTQRFAIKASYGVRKGRAFDIFKDPATAEGVDTKTSKKGMFKVVGTEDTYITISTADTDAAMFDSYVDRMETVFLNGRMGRESYDFDSIINRNVA